MNCDGEKMAWLIFRSTDEQCGTDQRAILERKETSVVFADDRLNLEDEVFLHSEGLWRIRGDTLERDSVFAVKSRSKCLVTLGDVVEGFF